MKNKRLYFKICFYRFIFKLKSLFVKKNKDEYILLINFNNLGDIICDTPSIRNISKAFPNKKIIMFVRNNSCVELLNSNPYIFKAIEMPHSSEPLKNYFKFAKKFLKHNFAFSMQFSRPFDEYKRSYLPFLLNIKHRYGLIQQGREKEYNKAFNHKIFLDNTTTRIEESLLLVKMLGIKIDNKKTDCFYDQTSVVKQNFGSYIIVQVCATLQCRMWHYTNFIELIKRILNKYPTVNILLTGVKKEKEYIEHIKNQCESDRVFVLCDINLSTLMDCIKNAKMIITNDTGPFHFAKALGVPSLTLFGISPPEYIIEKNDKNCYFLRGEKTCKANCKVKNSSNEINCLLFGKENKSCEQIYKRNPFANCINTIEVDDVFNLFEKIIIKENIKFH